MTKRMTSLLLAIIMLLQIVVPQNIFAEEDNHLPHAKSVKVGALNANSYDAKIMNELNRIEAKNRESRLVVPRAMLFSAGPYFDDNNEPKDKDKPKYYGNISVDFKTEGLDRNPFQWKEIFGVDEQNNPKPAQIIFTQSDEETGDETGVEYILKVTQTGKYTWQDKNGNPTKLPLFSKELKPYSYEVRVDEDVAENIKLLTARMTGTEGAGPTFLPENADGEIIVNITLDLGLHQVASTKFKSEWNTDVKEANRPQIQGTIEEKVPDLYDHPVAFDFPKNDTDSKIIRDWEDAFKDGLMVADALYKTPKVKIDEKNGNGLTFDTTKKTVKSGDHKFKYDFKYDVINGGKLTMTEVLPVTFDANGGKFASVTDSTAKQEIKKEVDYGKDLTGDIEVPKKALETFKGWATAKDATPLSKEDFDKAIKNIKVAKTFYAIWANNKIEAKELTVHESYKDGNYVNDFIPNLAKLKGQVKIKDASGTPQALKDDDKFAIVDGTKEYTSDGDDLKNYLYEKLKEKDNPNGEPTRAETVKAKITHANKTTQTVDIPIKVIKNIYEAKTKEGKPSYVPDGYVKVTVDPTTKAKDSQKYFYYVNPKAQVVIPGENPTGTDNWTFEKWIIKATTTKYELTSKPRHQFSIDTTIEAQYVSNIIPAKDDGSKPDNFVLVEFKAGTNGSLDGTTKYWVNPSAGKTLSDITHPTINPKDGWKENGWDKNKDTAITEATEVTAQYLGKVLTKEPTENKDKYVKVTFKQGDHGTIANTEKTQYWVLKKEEVDLKEPTVTAKTGYAHKTGNGAWSPKIAKYYYEDTVHTAQYAFNGQDVIEQPGNDKPTNVPEGYVLVTFDKGTNGEFEANQTIKYWVNPNKEVTLPEPAVTPNTGYRQQLRLNAWNKYLTATFTKTTTITAQYKELGDILTEEKPGYVKVEFKAGNNGRLDGTQTYWVNPLKGKKLGDITHPSVSPNAGYIQNAWDKADDTAINKQTTSPLVVTAKYLEKVLKAEPTANKDKYVTVEFTKGAHGEIKTGDTAKYWVLKNTEVSLTAPGVTPATGYAQKSGDEAWSPKTQKSYAADTVHVAQYVYTGNDVIPAGPNGSKPATVPDNFVLVTFESGTDGKIDVGQTVKYWVNPNKEVTVNAPSVTANQGYEQKPNFNAWDRYLTATFTKTTTITAQYNKLGDILTENKPGYVKVEFKQGTNGTLDGTTVYYVNPAANKKLSDIRHPNVTANTDYKHVGWDVEESTVIKTNTDVNAKYLEKVLKAKPTDDADKYLKVTFDKGDHGTLAVAEQKEYWVLKNTEVTLKAPTVTPDTAKGFKQKDGKDAWSPEIATAYSKDTTHVAQYEYQGQNVIPQTGTEKPSNVPDDFVKVTFKPTDKAATNVDKIFWVKPNVDVTIPIAKPEGKKEPVSQTNPKAYEWQFTKWVSEETKSRTWEKNIDDGVTAIFKDNTEIKAEYKKVITDQGSVLADEVIVHESKDESGNWVNNFIDKEATEAILKAAVKVTNASGQPVALPRGATVTLLDDSGKPFANDEALKNVLYDKLKEKDDNNEPIRTEKLKAKVKFANNEEQTVDIPIKVYKNIYEAKTKEGKPSYVPDGYVKVTVDPTTKAKVPQKTYYYVNPDAKVVIPGEAPTGTGNNKFVKWTMKADTATGEGTEYKLKDKPRTQFKEASTITAQYVSDVIPQDGPNKPDTVPINFVDVKFVPTDKATDTTEKIFWVNPEKEVTIPVKDPVGKQYFTFKEWKIDDTVYKPSEVKQFKTATTITATYDEAKNIISYNPSEPITRPDGYVRVTFAADPGLKLTEQKAYYVKKNASIKLDNAELVKPRYEAQTGYKFDKWDKEDSLVIAETDIVVTARATKFDKVIPEKKDDGNKNDKPAGYKEVTFVVKAGDEAKGSITGVAKFYVNPTEYVTINPPATKAETGFEFGGWDKDATISTVYDKDTTITASFNGLSDVIPKTKPDGSENKKPEGYKTVTFVIDPATGGNIADKEVTVYYVNPAKDVTVSQPKTVADTGYTFEKWDADTTTAKEYHKDITVKGNFKKLDDIIPSTNDQGKPNAKPAGYVTVTFIGGKHGTLNGNTVFYINPKTKQKLSSINKPEVKPEIGYKLEDEAGKLTWEILDYINQTADSVIDKDMVIEAKYKELDSIVPEKNKQGKNNKIPDGYIAVTFSTEANGKIKGTTDITKVVYINPNKAVVLENQAPEVTPNTGFDFAGWDTQINRAIQYKDKDVIKAKYNTKGDVIPQQNLNGTDKPAGYLTVTFDKGDHGELSGKAVYYVKPNTEVTVPAPTVKPNTGWKQKDGEKAWDNKLTQTFTKDTKITAQYNPLENIIPGDQTKPEGYVTVTFDKGDHGTVSGTTIYYVNPKANPIKTLADITTKPTVTSNLGYKFSKWDKEDTIQIGNDITVKAEYEALPDVIPAGNNVDQPKGYVKVEFIAGANGRLAGGNKTYYVNPTKDVTVDKLVIPKPQANSGYKFLRWAESIDNNKVIKGDMIFEAIFIPIVKYPNYPGGPIPIYPEVRRETIIQEKVVKVPVPVSDNYFKEVRYMQGFNGYFRPNDGLTRAEAAQILANALVEDGYKYNPNFKISYKDVGEAWYTRAVKIVTEANVFAGYDDGNFKPQAKITRNEWIATLKRFQELGDASGNNMKLRDGHWAKGEIQAAFNEGWLKIYTDGLATYKGDEFIPRQEVAAVSNKAFKRMVDKTYIGKNNLSLVTYKDVNTSMWAYEDILCASNTFLDRKDRYIAHWVKEDKNQFNIDTSDFKIVQKNFQRNPR